MLTIPDVAFTRLPCVHGADDVSDPLPVRGKLRIADVAEARHVIEFERTPSGLRDIHLGSERISTGR